MPGAEPAAGAEAGRDARIAGAAETSSVPAQHATRVRVRYSKIGKIRFTSHRDVVRLWERALRRSGLPLAWSEGFSPHPLVSFGLALPTGAESLGEYLDVTLDAAPGAAPGTAQDGSPDVTPGAAPGGPIDAVPGPGGGRELVGWGDLVAWLTQLLPDGIAVQAMAPIAHGPASLQQEVSSCSWRMEVHGLAAEELASRVERLLAAPSVLVERERRGRTAPDDLRPAVLALAVAPSSPPGIADPGTPGGAWLDAELATHPRGVRPRELLEGLGPDVRLSRACRVHQWIERDGARLEPLGIPGTADGAAATHAEARAS